MIKKAVLTREQEALERAAKKFILSVREFRIPEMEGSYFASRGHVNCGYGGITRDTVRDALLFELAFYESKISKISNREKAKMANLVDQWVESHIELIGKAAFLGNEA